MDWYRLLVVGAVSLVLTRPVDAQRAFAFPVSARLSARLGQIQRGTVVRVHMLSGPRLTGVYLGMTGDSAFLRTAAGRSTPASFTVDSVWTRHRPILTEAVRGAVEGAMMGAAVQWVRGLLASCRGSPHYPIFPGHCRAAVQDVGRSAARGAVIWGAVSVSLAVAFPEWKLRSP